MPLDTPSVVAKPARVSSSRPDVKEANGGGVRGMPAPQYLKRNLVGGASWEAVDLFMSSSKLNGLSVPQRLNVYRMLASLLVKHARKLARHVDAPMSAKFVANCAVNIAAIFDQSFPGYVASGLAHIVASRYAAPD